jgi:hypothetical protein
LIPPALLDAGEDPELRGAPLAVLVWLWGQLEPHGYRAVKAEAVALTLRMKRDTVDRALRILTMHGYLEQGQKVGQCRTFRVLITRNRLAAPLNGHSHAR